MKVGHIILTLWLLMLPVRGSAQGVPLIRNVMPETYGAHNRNSDVVVKDDGTVYIANFEGLLYYDLAEWRILHTPSVTNLTRVYEDKDGRLWVGGYNYFGSVQIKKNGDLALQHAKIRDTFNGEVLKIWEEDDMLLFLVNDGTVYQVNNNKVIPFRRLKNFEEVESEKQTLDLGDGYRVEVRSGNGLLVTDKKKGISYTITEKNGLCSDNVMRVAYNGHGLLWGVTNNGIFSCAIPSAYSRFTTYEDLMGEVLSIKSYQGTMYVGTMEGLFRMNSNKTFSKVTGIDFACWSLLQYQDKLLAATANGIFSYDGKGGIKQITGTNCTALYLDGETLFSGESDGLWVIHQGKQPRKVCSLNLVSKIYKDDDGAMWIQSLYGQIWRKGVADSAFKLYKISNSLDSASVIVKTGPKVEVVSAGAQKPFPFPMFTRYDEDGLTWLTDNEGHGLYCWKDDKRQTSWDKLLYPVRNVTVRALYHKNHELWIGGQKGVIIVNDAAADPALTAKPQLRICAVKLRNDSLLWGGFNKMPQLKLDSRDRELTFTYALDYAPLMGDVEYRYKLIGDQWSAWSKEQELNFTGLAYGGYTLQLQAKLPTGELTEVLTTNFRIKYPIYMRWYMWILYVVLLFLLFQLLYHFRMMQLKREKLKLERTVRERTSEIVAQRDKIVKQKDEIQEKSQRLEKALDDLSNAQEELIRSEHMATVGKLTHGLVDRILNPVNYINNFSKMSGDLLSDIKQNIDDEKDHISESVYVDTVDVIGMLESNLQEITHQGESTTRVLKAMGEILKEGNTNMEKTDLIPLLQQCEETLRHKHKEEILQYHIRIDFQLPEGPLMVMGNGLQLVKIFSNILTNAVFAIVKKAQRQQFEPTITLNVNSDGQQLTVALRDNGIGIEQTIIDKVFDPFFTTKTTSEGVGIGLYLAREIVKNHQGNITVSSEKDEYTEFVVKFPLLTE